MTYTDILLCVLELIAVVFLYRLADYATRVLNSKWKLCYVIPFILCIVFALLYGFEKCMLGVYIGGILMLLGFFSDEKRIRRWSCLVSALSIILSIGICLVYPGYRQPDFVKEFETVFEQMKQHYNLSEHKGIDWDALYEEYLPQFQAAKKSHDEAACVLAWQRYTQEFHDMHVSFEANDKAMVNKAMERIAGNDYGLSLMTLANGKTVAVNVEPESEAMQAGIKNGTVITKWDGGEINDVINAYNQENEYTIYPFPVKENEDFYRALLVAGTGGDVINISFLDEKGNEQSATVSRIGNYRERLQNTVKILDQGVEISNLDWKDIDDETVLMRMRFMQYDQQENYNQMENEVREKLLAYKEAGVKYLIFDMRSNAGGSSEYVKALIKLIAPEGEHVYAYDGVFDKRTMTYLKDEATGNYQVGERESYQGENLWSHGDIVLLVNACTVSAGDHFTMLASAFPNVTIMGFTHSSCSAQGIHGVEFQTGYISYSSVLLVNEDGTVYIDTNASREATVPLDIRIPFDDEAVISLFDEGEDYVLSYARRYIENHR